MGFLLNMVYTEAYLELAIKDVNCFWKKHSIIDVWYDSKYTTAIDE